MSESTAGCRRAAGTLLGSCTGGGNGIVVSERTAGGYTAAGTLLRRSTGGSSIVMAKCVNCLGCGNDAALCTLITFGTVRGTCCVCGFPCKRVAAFSHRRRECGEHQENENRQDQKLLFHVVFRFLHLLWSI